MTDFPGEHPEPPGNLETSKPLLAELSMGAILSRLLAQAAPFGDRRPLPAANHHSGNDPGDPRLPGDRRRRFERKSDGVR